MINHSFVINLEARKDRLESFLTFLPEKFRGVQVFKAVNGNKCRHPAWWGAGPGAWGCYKSHLSILEQAISSDLPSYMVFEDDCEFDPDFDKKYESFINSIPMDWDMFYLGGQLLDAEAFNPTMVNANVYRPYNVNRTHCFAVNAKAYDYLYDFLLRRFEDREWHIDHHLGSLHQQRNFNVYCPPEWIVGQSEGLSDICCEVLGTRYYPHPITYLPYKDGMNTCVVLNAPSTVVKELIDNHDWHCGYSLNSNYVDKGLESLSDNPTSEIKRWWYYIKREAIEKSKTPFLYCPHKQLIDAHLPFTPFRIDACTTQEVLHQLKLGR